MLHFKPYEHVAYREGIQSSFSNTDRTVTPREAESLLAAQAQVEDADVKSTMCEIQEVTQKRHCLRTHMLSFFYCGICCNFWENEMLQKPLLSFVNLQSVCFRFYIKCCGKNIWPSFWISIWLLHKLQSCISDIRQILMLDNDHLSTNAMFKWWFYLLRGNKSYPNLPGPVWKMIE